MDPQQGMLQRFLEGRELEGARTGCPRLHILYYDY